MFLPANQTAFRFTVVRLETSAKLPVCALENNKTTGVNGVIQYVRCGYW
ncbi:hypothetical protein DES39_0365 [Orbus hercynius]|uniref:Uncharacterized protein n=1 Tax=Orbus hercynius TaxID=593135 RepID=A0A495RIL6_9GAMM|nr:hypothetical protein DES39_0365 [Orbus hercynius]